MPVTKKLACMSQTWTSWLSSDVSKAAGRCQSTMTALNESTANHGEPRNLPTRRSVGAHGPSSRNRPAVRRVVTGSACSSGIHGAPATISIGAKKAISRCSPMWTKK